MSIVSAQKQKTNVVKELKRSSAVIMDEVVVLCPKCKTFETVWFNGNSLIKTQKFIQENTGVYHDCGSKEPCLLLSRFLKRGRIAGFHCSTTA